MNSIGLSTRVKRGKRVKATRGEPNHSWRPFGFEQDGVTIRESESVVLREMVARVLAGKTKITSFSISTSEE